MEVDRLKHRNVLGHHSGELVGFASPEWFGEFDICDRLLCSEEFSELPGPAPLGALVHRSQTLLFADQLLCMI